jgi:type III secretory pathway component EscS
MTKPSTDLIDRYLQAVGFWLPRAQKQDILAELSEDLRSQLEDREAELGRSLTESEVGDLLKKRGRPIFVAGQFLPQQNLIGPALYPIYVFVLKIVALCYIVPWIAVWLGILLFNRAQTVTHLSGEWHSLGTLWTIIFTQFGIITVVFAVIDRLSVKSPCMSDWDPRKLPRVKLETPTKRRYNAVCGIVAGLFGLLWLLAVPKYPFLIIGPAAYLVKGAPIWQTVYWPLVALAVAGVFEHVVRLLRPDLTWFPPTFQFGTTLLSAWIVNALLHTRLYVLPVIPQGAGVAAAVNLSILITCGVLAVLAVVGLIVYGWQAIREIRRSMPPRALHLA